MNRLALVVLLLALLSLQPQQVTGNGVKRKLIVWVHMTRLWFSKSADLDPDLTRGDSDVWVFTLVEQPLHGMQARAFGERTVGEEECDKNGNDKYDKGDVTISPISLYSEKGATTDVIYRSEQCDLLRPLNLYVRAIDSDTSGSDATKFLSKVVGKVSKIKPLKFGRVVEGLIQLIGSLFEDYDLIGQGSKGMLLPSKRYEVMRGSKPGERWNLGPEADWKEGEIPPPNKAWVSEEMPVEIRSEGKVRAIAWIRIVVYNTGAPCAVASKEGATLIKDKSGLRFRLDDVKEPVRVRVEGAKTLEGNLSTGEEFNWLNLDYWDGTTLAGRINLGPGLWKLTFQLPDRSTDFLMNLPEEEVTIVCNEVDEQFLFPLIGELESKGIEYRVVRAGSPVRGKLIVVGGPDSYHGVGELVRTLVSAEVQEEMRRRPTVFTSEGLVVAGGPDRYGTADAVRRIHVKGHGTPVLESGPNTFMGVEQPLDPVSHLVFSEPVNVVDAHTPYNVQLTFNVDGRVVSPSFPDYRPDNVTFSLEVEDLRGNRVEVNLSMETDPGKPYLEITVDGVEEGPLQKEFQLSVMNLGDAPLSARFLGAVNPPPFVEVEASPIQVTVPPGGVAPVLLTVKVKEGASEGTYRFQVRFVDVEYGVLRELTVQVRVW